MARTFWMFGLLAAGLMTPSRASAVPVPVRNIEAMVERADVVVVGTVVAIVEQGATAISTPTRTVPGRIAVAGIRIDRMLKGPADRAHVQVQFVIPDKFIGYPSIPEGTSRVFFLTRTKRGFSFVSPYDPSVIGLPVLGAGVTALDKTIESIAAVAASPDVTFEQKLEAIHTLWGQKHAAALAGLRIAQQAPEPVVSLSAAAALLSGNDVAGLAVAETALLRPYADVSPVILHNLRVGIEEGLRDEAGIPALTRLLGAINVETRRMAASALGHTNSRSAIGPLLLALDDPDMHVKHNAVVGLAEIHQQPRQRPSFEGFAANPDRYISHWKQ